MKIALNGRRRGPVFVTIRQREVEIAMRFETYTNPDIPYMFHCHFLDPEDVGMIGQFQVVDG